MSENVRPFPPNKSLSALGVNVRAPKIGAELTLAATAKNLSTGLADGLGPRFGCAPIPNHNTWEAPQATYYGGLAYNEDGSPSLLTRRKVFGVSRVNLGNFAVAGAPVVIEGYGWIVTKTQSSSLDLIDLWVGESTTGPVAELAGGFAATGAYPNTAQNVMNTLFFRAPSTAAWATYAKAKCSIATTQGYGNVAVLTVSGADVAMPWMIGETTIAGSSTVPCTAAYSNDGFPTAWSTRSFKDSARTLTIFDLDLVNGLQYQFDYDSLGAVAGTSLYTEAHWLTNPPAIGTLAKTVPASLPAASSIATRLDGAGSSAASVDYQLLHDTDSVCNTGFSLFCVAAGGSPVAFMTKPWLVNAANVGVPWPVDLTVPAVQPADLLTNDDSGAATRYREDGTPRSTCFKTWPSYTSGTALPTHAASATTGQVNVRLGAADSGILRADTDYEFTFAYYNKLTGYESNVGTPARFRTGTDDFVALSLYRDVTSTGAVGGSLRQRIPVNANPSYFPFAWPTSSGGLNYIEIRFYYRVYGTFEWLPALSVDIAKLFYYPNLAVLWACTGAIAALPGGQPGGFNDYSPLPKANYIDCLEFQGRMFWFTSDAIRWSYKNNPLAYAGRNSAAARGGVFLGGKVHVYKGEREDKNSSRLLICGSDAIFTGRFTGVPIEQPIQVSPDTIEPFPQEGSDFAIDFWTTFTAFSGRAMVVGDGNLYYWGPNGVFGDEGLGVPQRISAELEPDLFDLIDDTKTNHVFGVFCDATQEVIWFYPPRGGDGTSTGVLSFNIQTRRFQFGEMEGQVDAGQPIQVTRESVDWKGLAGQRSLIFTRASSAVKVQRAYFFDQRCLGGDVRPFADMLGYSIAAQGSDWRVTLAQGSIDATNIATVAAGDYVSFLQFDAYTRSYIANRSDFIALVVGKGTSGGRNYIDIRPPASITLQAATFPTSRCPPIQHIAAASAGLNAFEWRLPTNYWAPAGLDFEAFWKWLHLMFKVELVESRRSITWTLSCQTPQDPNPVEATYLFRDNFDGNYQAYAPLYLADSAPMSQAIKLTLSGYQIGGSWVLQYLSPHGAGTKRVDFLKEWQPERA